MSPVFGKFEMGSLRSLIMRGNHLGAFIGNISLGAVL